MLQSIGQDIWIVDGPNVTGALGFHFPTRMVVIRLLNGDLLIWSPIALTVELRTKVDGLGRVAHIIAPNTLHYSYVADWMHAFPQALSHAAPGLERAQPAIGFHSTLAEAANVAWSSEVEQVIIGDNRLATEVVFFHKPSGTVLFTDLLQQFPADWFSGWRRIVAKLDLMSASKPEVPRKFRMAFTNHRRTRERLRLVLAWPVKQVVMAHGTPVLEDGRIYLRQAFRWLKI